VATVLPQLVDDLPAGHWLGYVVPKRHARRAVTRNLLKRQIRSVFERHAQNLPGGLWLVRLKTPFAPAEFVSARSRALAVAARAELEGLLVRCHPAGGPSVQAQRPACPALPAQAQVPSHRASVAAPAPLAVLCLPPDTQR